MADVDMTDAPSTSGAGPVKRAAGAKAKGPAGDGGADGKKRFEVKKVRKSCGGHITILKLTKYY
jgi:hypothetical protein